MNNRRLIKLLESSRDAIPLIGQPKDHSIIDFNGHYWSFDEYKKELLRMTKNKETVKGRVLNE